MVEVSGKGSEEYREIVEYDAVYRRRRPQTGGRTRREPELFLSQIKHSGNKVSARCNRSVVHEHAYARADTCMCMHVCMRACARICTRTAVTHVARSFALKGFVRLLQRNKNSNVPIRTTAYELFANRSANNSFARPIL